jgi:hypothetical protein
MILGPHLASRTRSRNPICTVVSLYSNSHTCFDRFSPYSQDGAALLAGNLFVAGEYKSFYRRNTLGSPALLLTHCSPYM